VDLDLPQQPTGHLGMNSGFRSVAAIAQAVATGALSASDVVADYLSRAAASQDAINAFTLFQQDSAMAAAASIDERVAAGEDAGPLAGVPIAIKDLIDHAGFPNTAGSSYPTSIPTASATVVVRLQAAGAVIIGRTGLHEYAFGFSSENHWSGPVRNPWDTALSPGGSSGGSAAAVSADVAATALGTDTGGSVRVPAALCGVVGLKVTHGRVPLTGVFPLAPSLDTVGPLARSSHDATLVYLTIAGYDAADPWSAPRPVIAPEAPESLPDVTVGIPHPWVDLPQTDSVAAAFAAARSELSAAGVNTVDLDLPDLVPAAEIEHVAYPEVALVHHERWHNHPETYGPDVAQRIGEVFDIDPTAYVEAQQWRARVRHVAEEALTHCDFLMTPAVAANVKPIGDEEIDVAGKMVSYRPQLSRYSALVNHTGLPAITLPLDMTGTPPPSVQLIADRWQEHRLLEMGTALERLGVSRYRQPPTTGQ
jgi:Asp-tRNA(Asn)/Glu-tRNA(Gln) amidotransferase A subunit family amidase